MIISCLSYIMSKNTWEMRRCKRLTGISLNTEPLWYSRTPASALSSWRLSGAPETDLPDANARWRSSFYFGVWATFEPSWQNKEHRHCLHVGRFYLQAGRCSYSAPSSSCSRRCWYSQPRRGTEHKIEEAETKMLTVLFFFFLLILVIRCFLFSQSCL